MKHSLILNRYNGFEQARKDWFELELNGSCYPFQQWWYLKLFAESFCKVEDVFLLGVKNADGKILVCVGFEKVGDIVVLLGMKRVLGGNDLTDYGGVVESRIMNHELRIEYWKLIFDFFRDLGIKEIQLDFIREDSCLFEIFENLKDFGSNLLKLSVSNNVIMKKQEVSPYLRLPKSWDEYLLSLSRVKRKELKRKINRLENGSEFKFYCNKNFVNDFDDFVRLHRLSKADKEDFMSEPMKDFFWKLLNADSSLGVWKLCFLEIEGKKVASILAFQNDKQILLYNSGYDPEYNYYSVGLILKAYNIRQAINDGKTVYDFLRGDERYKFDLGGVNMDLYKFKIVL